MVYNNIKLQNFTFRIRYSLEQYSGAHLRLKRRLSWLKMILRHMLRGDLQTHLGAGKFCKNIWTTLVLQKFSGDCLVVLDEI